jgi:hypothetical protein
VSHGRYHRRRKELIEQLGGACRRCGSMEDLEIDHIDPRLKTMNVSRVVCEKWDEAFYKELENCQLLCTECHLEKTKEDMQYLPSGTHGTITMATHGKCRCDACRAIKSIYQREYRVRKRMQKAIDIESAAP